MATAGGREDWPLYFLHIPRTAGTSLTAELDNRFAAADIFPGSLLFQLVDVPLGELSRYRLFRGHFGLVLPRLLDWQVRCMTVLREPVALVTSMYAFICAQPWHPVHQRLRQPGYGLSEFLRDPACRAYTSNWQARWLAVEPPAADLAWASVPESVDLSHWQPQGHHLPLDIGHDELLERSAVVVERHSLVGVTERLSETLGLLATQLRWSAPAPPARLNVSKLSPEQEEMTAADVDLVRELNQVDAELYSVASRRLDRDLATAPRAPAGRWPRLESAPYEYDFSMPLFGTGWRARAFDGRYGWLRWTGPGTESVLELPVAVNGRYLLEAYVITAAAADLLTSLTIFVAEVPVALSVTTEDPGFVYRGTIDVVHDGPVPLTLRVPHTGAVGDQDGLGVALSRLRLSPTPSCRAQGSL